MKVGDKVKVFDGSYSLSIKSGKLEPNYGLYLKRYGSHTVVAIDCDLPAAGNDERNDTVIIADSNGIVTFIQENFLMPTKRYCPTCGQVIKA